MRRCVVLLRKNVVKLLTNKKATAMAITPTAAQQKQDELPRHRVVWIYRSLHELLHLTGGYEQPYHDSSTAAVVSRKSLRKGDQKKKGRVGGEQ